MNEGLQGYKLPAKTRPLPDELLFSWIARLALSNASEPMTFSQITLPGQNIWSNSVNGGRQFYSAKILSQLVDLPEKNILYLITHYRLSKSYIFEEQNYGRYILLKSNIVGNNPRNNWLQFCPICFKEDDIPYYRTYWRLSILTVCHKHHCRLLNCCPECNSPINLSKLSEQYREISSCYNCNCNFKLAPTEILPSNDPIFHLANMIMDGFNSGWVKINSQTIIMFPLFCSGLWILLKPFFNNKYVVQYTNYFTNLSHHNDYNTREKKLLSKFNGLTIEHRHNLLAAVSKLLETWPKNFIQFARTTKLPQVAFAVHSNSPPYWLIKQLKKHTNKQPYRVNNTEFESGALYLLNHNYSITFGNVAEALGLNRSVHRTIIREKIITQLSKQQTNTIQIFHYRD